MKEDKEKKQLPVEVKLLVIFISALLLVRIVMDAFRIDEDSEDESATLIEIGEEVETEEEQGLLDILGDTVVTMSDSLEKSSPPEKTTLDSRMWLDNKISELRSRELISNDIFGAGLADRITLELDSKEVKMPATLGDIKDTLGVTLMPDSSIPGHTSTYGTRISTDSLGDLRINTIGGVNTSDSYIDIEEAYACMLESLNPEYYETAYDGDVDTVKICGISIGDSYDDIFKKLEIEENVVAKKQSDKIGKASDFKEITYIRDTFSSGRGNDNNWYVTLNLYNETGVEQISKTTLKFEGNDVDGVTYYSYDFQPYTRSELLNVYKNAMKAMEKVQS